MRRFLPKNPIIIYSLILSLILVFSAAFAQPVAAVNLSAAMLRFNRMQTNVINTTVLVVAKSSTSTTDTKIRVVFEPNSYSIDSTAANIIGSTANVTAETLTGSNTCTAMPIASSVANAVSSSSVDFSLSSNLSTGTYYCFYVTKGVGTANTTATASLQNRIEKYNGSTLNETSRVGTATISSDQVTITAVVPAIFTFTLSGTTDSFQTDLSTARTTSTSGITVTVATNAQSGWEAWLKSANGNLSSASTGSNIPTTGTPGAAAGTISVGTSAYVLHVLSGTGSPTIDAGYDGSGGVNKGGALSSGALQRIAYNTAPTTGDTITLYGRAGVSATQKAATDYTDTWTVVGAGQF